MITAPHHNQQVFSDYYLDTLLPQRTDWQELVAEPDPRTTEAQEKLGTLAARQLDLRDVIGSLNEEQWKWLVKRRLNRPDLVELTKVFRARQSAIAALDKRIAVTNSLIDQVVYRLYGMAEEEVAAVETRIR